jgi:acetyl esterase/lipase
MSRRLLVTAAALVAAAVTVVAGSPGAAAARSRAEPTLVEADESYGPAARQVVTVIRPAGTYANRRTAVFIHGGGWTGGSRATWDAEAREWASHGWITINVEYRRAAFDGRPGDGPEIAQDVVAVYRKYAPLRLTGEFVFVGDSAGGQLATTVGSQLGKRNVAGIVAWSPVASPKAMAARAGDAGRTQLQRELGRKAEEFWSLNYDGWSAHRYIRTGAAPPMYVVGGALEGYVDWEEQGRSLCTTRGFTGVCAPVQSDLHGTSLWRTTEGARQRVHARRWAENLTR